MSFHRLLSRVLPVLAILLHVPLMAQSTTVRDQNVEARLISSHSTIKAGEPFTIGLQFNIDPTWHTYWSNPGETGLPTSLKLDLPSGFTAGELQFPVPKKFITDYGFDVREAGYGYETSVVHPMTITPPADLKAGETITITGKTAFLMCDPHTCIPGKADLSITLQTGSESVTSPENGVITFFTKKLPTPVEAPLAVSLEGENVVLKTRVPAGSLPGGAKLHFYPLQNLILDAFADAAVTVAGDDVTITGLKHESLTEAPTEFAGLIVAETGTGKSGFRVSTAGAAAGTAATQATSATTEETAPGSGTESAATSEELPFGGGILGIVLAAFLGGIILNVMPCVFPVISLKVMSFVGLAGEDKRKVLAHSLVFALGILVFFWLLTIAMLVLRSVGGEDIGWGVQLRYPGFVIGLIFVMVIVALSLFGVFEIGASMTAVGGDLANKSGYAGSFWSGALAVLLATPCTAPLMAPAIGFALAAPAPLMFLVFTSLGLGLAAPYFIFAIFPKLLDHMPAPGAWMETFKQLMGFPMLAVVVWLTGVLSKQLDVAGLQWALTAVLFVAIAGWIIGRFAGYERSTVARNKARIAAASVFLLAVGVAWNATGKSVAPSTIDIAEVIAGHRAEGKHVFVDFTAEWCITCKVNKRVAINTAVVQEAFKANNVAFVTADWTNEDPSITSVLAEFGRSGVPFYLLYPADTSKPPLRFGDGILTSGDILEAIEKLK
ncbi:MAG: thioredoxin family protein [Verrucomicrobiales bacterium]|jgi:thiol:disulfide interchange protein|nr:thioredoxin family protein [Verrucomicrobiales bacterium]MDP4792587.1 thioredoxin family protein [Verrucomicrobiales bacterium]MDP4940063.1 thioredoxin family protein [Verrucomicrobiales bacterium]MDP5006994.1 thioredoxin family protein [Verrucomicrobiales bacterium]